MTATKEKSRWQTIRAKTLDTVLEKALIMMGVLVYGTLIFLGYAGLVWLFPGLAVTPGNRSTARAIATLYTAIFLAILLVVALIAAFLVFTVTHVVVTQYRIWRDSD